MSFARFPLVHLSRGRLEEYPTEAPAPALQGLAKRAEMAYVVDLQGLTRNKADLDIVREASRKAALWVDGGSRYATDVMDLFIAGAERVTVRWNTLHSYSELIEASDLSEEVYLGVEFQNGFVDNRRDPAGSVDHLFRSVQQLGVGLVLIDLAGGAGPQINPQLAHLGARYQGRKWYMGGSGDAFDRETLDSLAYSGLLVPARAMPEASS
ncbi:MAG TPA: HisA/HisF-related TIM barrel protein [Candidatus Thermoplasmatota archaeon]|nr:HisA/HisF-related TIM barrel protein [Candidatus Thermoplasmatota archaeon]